MGFWNDNLTEPKRAFRFMMDLGLAENEIASYFIKQVKKPTFSMDAPQEVKYIGHTFKYPGRIKWNPIDVTIIDPASPDGAAILMNILANSGYQLPWTQELAGPSISKSKANNAFGRIAISQIDDEARIIETWTLHNAFITNVDFGQLSYDSDEIVNYTLTIEFDNASLSTSATPVNPKVQSRTPIPRV